MSGKSRSSSSLRTFLHVWIVGLTLSALALSSLFWVKNAEDQIAQQMQLAHDLTQLYADDSVSIEYGRNNLVYVADSLRRLNQLLKGETTRILSNDGAVTESTNPSEIGSRPDFGKSVIQVEVREHSSAEKLGTLEVVINRHALFIAALKKAALPTLLLLLFLSAICTFIIRSLQRRIIQPIEQILGPTPVTAAEGAHWPTEFQDLHTRLQEALARRDLAVVGQIAGGVIHDLKTLLHSVWTATHLANEQPEASEKRQKRLESLLKAANTNFPKMNDLIQTTLDGATEIRLQPRPGSLVTTLEQAIKATEHLAARSHVKVELEVKGAPAVATYDPIQMERALTNLVKNAVEAAAADNGTSKPSVLIRASELSGQGYQIAVEDSGPGLGEDPAHVFQSVRSTKTHGSGLGLVISRKIIEAHSGRLTAGISNTLGGAKFDIILPHQEQQV